MMTFATLTGEGITPACAGKTGVSISTISRTMDHPRMRGEDFIVFILISFRLGSPPHARGRHNRPG